jgi:hypothetical protein
MSIIRTSCLKFREIEVYGTTFRCYPDGDVYRQYKRSGKFKLCSNNKPARDGYILAHITTASGDKTVGIHRIAYRAFHPEFDIYDERIEIDHRNVDKTDNSIGNLRLATRGENQNNRPKHSNNTSGYKNIIAVYDKKTDTWYWKVQIGYDRVGRHQKYFRAGDGEKPDQLPPIPQHVIDYRDEMLRKLHGEFANFG